MKRIKISVEGIDPKPGEVIIAKCKDKNVGMLEARDLHEALTKMFPDNPVYVIPSEFIIKELDKGQLKQFIKSMSKYLDEGEREEE